MTDAGCDVVTDAGCDVVTDGGFFSRINNQECNIDLVNTSTKQYNKQ